MESEALCAPGKLVEQVFRKLMLLGMDFILQYFGHLMRRVDSLEKTDVGRDWGQEEKGTTEYMTGWHHQLDGHEFE